MNRNKALGVVAIALAGFGLFEISSSAWQSQPPTVLDGVYTVAQAKRGQAAYETACATCHHTSLGGFSGAPLKGMIFLDRWREFPLKVLFTVIQENMPKGAPGTLPEKDYLDILAYILEANGSPAGAKELAMAGLPEVLFVGPGGPMPLPTSTDVKVVGCLTLDTSAGWFLTRAGEPSRTLNAWEVDKQELADARALPLGGQLYRLQNITEVEGYTPEGFLGKKVLAKGVLVRQPKNERINVNALQVVNSDCDR